MSAEQVQDGPRLVIVLWSGDVGGAEILKAALALRMRRLGADVAVLFVDRPGPVAERLERAEVPFRSLRMGPGRAVLRRPRHYANAAAEMGPDGALLVECGFMGAALRLGGYRGAVIGVEHGTLNLFPGFSRPRRLWRRLARFSGAWADDIEVAVSDWMLEEMRRHAHARNLKRIYNGIDSEAFPDPEPDSGDDAFVVGFMGRLAYGKGADHLLRAYARVRREFAGRLLIAGEGPQRPALVKLAADLDITREVEFLGRVDDVAGFWGRCTVAAVPAAELNESFSMVTLEAMVCARPVVATRNGAIPELVSDGSTGLLVPPCDDGALAEALVAYASDPELRQAHGAAGRERALSRFELEDSARAYLELFASLAR